MDLEGLIEDLEADVWLFVVVFHYYVSFRAGEGRVCYGTHFENSKSVFRIWSLAFLFARKFGERWLRK